MFPRNNEARPHKVYLAVTERTAIFHWPASVSYKAASARLIAVTIDMAKTLLKQNDFGFTIKACRNARPLGITSTEGIAADLCVSYYRGEWSLLSDKPTRPTAKVLAPATLDA